MKKPIILLLSLGVLLPLYVYQVIAPQGLCGEYNFLLCEYDMSQVVRIQKLFLLVFIFSLITYKLPAAVFDSWWRFAKFAIPTILALVIIINLRLHHSTGGFMNIDHDIDRLVATTLFAFFTAGSFIQIYRGWRQTKSVKKVSK